MSHVRAEIRQQAATELADAISVFKEIDTTKLYAYRESQLPALNIYTETESSEPITLGSQLGTGLAKRTMRRQLNLITEIYATSSDESLDDALDDLAVEVEKVLEATLLNDLASDIALLDTNFSVDGAGEIPVGVTTLTWLVIYRTLEGDPEVSI